MSLTGSIVILVVIIARAMMKKLPKKYVYLLWGIAGLRLLCPIAFESKISIFNIRPLKQSVETVKDLPLITYGSGHYANAAAVNNTVAEASSAASDINLIPLVLTIVWAAIAVGIICYVIWQYVVMRRDLKNVKEVASGIYAGHQIDSPFVMGVVNPKIYLPRGLTDKELSYMILHERTHIRRGDVFFKIIGILILAIHWFNPLVWIAYALFVQDMEMSCDEAVITKLGKSIKADYSMSLVSLATRSNAPKYIVVPVAFSKALLGRKEVKMRIKHVLGYNGTTKLVTTMSLVLVAAVGLVCLFNAQSFADTDYDDEEAQVEETAVEDNGVEVTTDEDGNMIVSSEGTDFEGEVSVTLDEDTGLPVVISSDSGDETEIPAESTTAAEAAAAASPDANDASIGLSENNILGISVPIIVDLPVDAELNLPEGTTADDGENLGFYIQPGKKLAGDAYSVYYLQAPGSDVIDDFCNKLDQSGFTIDRDGSGNFYTIRGENADGIHVMVERDGDYFRISYYVEGTEDATSYNAFRSVG